MSRYISIRRVNDSKSIDLCVNCWVTHKSSISSSLCVALDKFHVWVHESERGLKYVVSDCDMSTNKMKQRHFTVFSSIRTIRMRSSRVCVGCWSRGKNCIRRVETECWKCDIYWDFLFGMHFYCFHVNRHLNCLFSTLLTAQQIYPIHLALYIFHWF